MNIADIGLTGSIIFCGCGIDHAFDTAGGAAIWLIAFGVGIVCLIAMGKGQK